jgi:SAM-dependent methyltransferase
MKAVNSADAAKKPKYFHSEAVHNLAAPKAIVPEMMRLINPRTIVDVGCGIGTFLHCFKQEGAERVLGIDGSWVDHALLAKYLEPQEFIEHDLESTIKLDQRFDLVVSLEVAEHISPASADLFVKNLVDAGDVIMFSAAIPWQGGQNHINEQWIGYWEGKFRTHGFVMHDVLRPLLWTKDDVFWWYRQNIVLFTKSDFKFREKVSYNELKDIVHRDHYLEKARQMVAFFDGELGPVSYAKLLAKSILGKEKWKQIKKFLHRGE